MSATIEETDEERQARLEAEQAELDAEGTVNVQDGLFDQVIDDAELEAVLDEREKRRQKRLAANTAFKEKHDVAKGKLDALDLPDDTVVRCGRHRITVKRTEPKDVAFTTGGKRQMRIFPILDD